MVSVREADLSTALKDKVAEMMGSQGSSSNRQEDSRINHPLYISLFPTYHEMYLFQLLLSKFAMYFKLPLFCLVPRALLHVLLACFILACFTPASVYNCTVLLSFQSTSTFLLSNHFYM